ncbi:PaaI family thioesterase [bacterium]|nr:PaaI family thioesterase [bacterium]
MESEHLLWVERPEPGWTPAALPFLALENTFVSGDPSGKRLTIRYFRRDEDDSLRAKVLFGEHAQGPPGHVHGGAMAGIMDEAMGGAAWLAGYPVVAAQLEITFRELLPLAMRAVVKAQVTGVEGRKVHTRAFLTNTAETVIHCQSTGLFIVLDRSQLERMPQEAARIVRNARTPRD